MTEQSEVFFRLIAIALLSGGAQAVDPEMDKVVKMDIQAVYDQQELANWMHFVRVFRDRKDTEADELWKDNRKVANG